MSKELAPLKAFNKFLEYVDTPTKMHLMTFGDKKGLKEYRLLRTQIETALKRLEKIETTTHSVLREDISNELKAFTLLDDCDIDVWLIKHCDYENYCRVRTLCLKATGNADVDDANREVINLPTEKEFDFLKEILEQ